MAFTSKQMTNAGATKELINTLEIAGNPTLSESLPDISRLVQKIGTNRLLSRKTVSFSFSEPYQIIPILRPNSHLTLSKQSSTQNAVNHKRLNWCPRQDLNLYDVTH